jgi:hypothetical protein
MAMAHLSFVAYYYAKRSWRKAKEFYPTDGFLAYLRVQTVLKEVRDSDK